MPIFFQQHIDESTRLAIWKIEESENFFDVPLQRSITHPHKRLQHLAGRYLLRHLFPDFPLDLIKIADTKKPFLENEDYHFSISHCLDFAAAIVSKNRRVGIDVEVPTEKVERIKEKFLHTEELINVRREMSIVNEINDKQQTTNSKLPTPNSQLTLLWCAKEAVYKWWSYGGVDFSEMIRLALPPCQDNIGASFLYNGKSIPLKIYYKFFPEVCLAYLAE